MTRPVIALRIAAAYAVVVALVGAVGAVGLVTIGRIRGETATALERHWRVVALGAQARDLTSVNARITFSIFLMTDRDEIDRALRWRQQNTDGISRILADLEPKLGSEVERAALAAIVARRKPYVSSYLRALDLLLNQGRPVDARAVMVAETTPLLVEYQEAWHAFVTVEGRLMDEAGRDALEHYEDTRRELLLLTAAALLAAVAIAVQTVRVLVAEERRRRAAEAQLSVLNHELEERVRAQTSQLSAANREVEGTLADVRRTTAALQQSEARYRLLFEGAEDAMLTLEGGDWHITSANPASQRLFGMTSVGDLLGRSPAELSPERQPGGEPSREQGQAMLEMALRQGSHYFEWTYLRGGTVEVPAAVLLTRMELDGTVIVHATVHDISGERKIQQSQRRVATAVAAAAESVVITDLEGRIQYVNPAFEKLSGYSLEEVVGQNPRVLKSGLQPPELYRGLWTTIAAGQTWSGRLVNRKKDGTLYHEDVTISPVHDGDRTVAYVAVKRDVTREVELEGQLLHEGKLAAVGELAAGIAHEINTPTQFVSDSLHFLSEGSRDLLGLVDSYREALAGVTLDPASAGRLEAAEARADLGYLRENMPAAFDTSLEGMQRIATIVRAMKDFSHPGQTAKAPADLNQALETTLTIAANTYKYVAEVERDLGDIPLVSCSIADINQVFLNLIVNAAHAIGDVVKDSGQKGLISVKTRLDGDHVKVSITDTGMGIPEAVRARIFEPFFTTKPVGKGTGQGLAIARSIVVNKHGGTLTFTSAVGRGSTFIVSLPMSGAASGVAA